MYDVIIIGAGPAGTSAARSAGKLGLKTIIIEKEKLPRYKPCGGVISQLALSWLDFDLPEEIIENHTYGIRMHFYGKSIEKKMKEHLSILVTREKFDYFLMRKALETGIKINQGENVKDFSVSDNFVTLRTDKAHYTTKYLIISSGSSSLLERKLRKNDTKNSQFTCVVTETEKEQSFPRQSTPEINELFFNIADMGYGWIFPGKNHYSVGYGGISSKIKNPKKALVNFLKEQGFAKNYKIHGHILPIGGIKRTITSQNVLLCGDAAGFVDPFLGEGIPYAIRSGQLAAETIHQKITNRISSLKPYEIKCHKEFGHNLTWSYRFLKILHTAPTYFFNRAFKDEKTVEKFIQTFAMGRCYKSYLFWIVKRMVLGEFR